MRKMLCAQELKDLQAAKQLFIQQKVELQGKVEAAQASLEQEQRDHQKTRDSIKHTQQQLKGETDKLQKQLVQWFSLHCGMFGCYSYRS